MKHETEETLGHKFPNSTLTERNNNQLYSQYTLVASMRLCEQQLQLKCIFCTVMEDNKVGVIEQSSLQPPLLTSPLMSHWNQP